MAYSQYSKIESTDFNNIVGTSSTSTTGELNAVWGVGNNSKGYGQNFVPQVSQNAVVNHTDWANAVNTTSTIANHQGTVITAVTAASTGDTIAYSSAITTNITNVTSGRLNAAAQGVTNSTATTAGISWLNQLTFTQTVTFASGDAARYFFNAGGQITLSFASPSGSGINTLMNSLAAACGTIIISSTTSGTVSIAGTSYSGVTKVGGSGSVDTLSTNSGYYGLGTTDTVIFKQFATGTPSGYTSSYITVSARTNGTQGNNGDNGNIITITTVWDEVPNGLAVATGTSTTIGYRAPRSTADIPSGYLTNTWGTPSLSGSVTGS